MAIESDADRLVFLDSDEFGVDVTYDGGTIKGYFRDLYLEEFDMERSQPILMVRSADVSGISHGDSVVISGTTYKVRGVQPEGTGMTNLRLEAQ